MVCSSGGFSQLQQLVLCGLEEWEEWIVEESSMPLLHVLHIIDCQKLKELPHGKHLPSHLTTIFLRSCGLVEDPMPILEKLLQLKEVYLYKSFSGRTMVCSRGGFPELQKLSIDGLEGWEEWVIEECSMPLLHSLTIDDCPKLEELRDGLRLPYSLKHLTISGKWMDRFSLGGKDYSLVQHIPFIKFLWIVRGMELWKDRLSSQRNEFLFS